jgi:anti-anti-sigma factor
MAETQFRHLQCRIDHGVLVLTITEAQMQGDLLADELRQEFLAAVTAYGATKVVVDFQRVKYMGSAGFRPLLSLYRRLHDTGGRMVFCQLAPEVQEVFLITRLISTSRSSTTPFVMEPDLASALARLRYHTMRTEQGVLILTVIEPELFSDSVVDALGQELVTSVTEAKAQKVVLNLEQVTTIRTAAFRPFLRLRAQLLETGGRLVICGLAPAVAEVFEVTKVATSSGAAPLVFETAPTVAEAIARLNG